MKYDLIYEADKPNWFGWLNWFIIIILIVAIFLLCYGVYYSKKLPDAKLINKIIPFFVSVFLFYIIICQIYTFVDSNIKVWGSYINGEAEIIEGSIEEYFYSYDNGGELNYDNFSVSGIYFRAPGFVSTWGYPLRQIDGSILEEGMQVKIHYVTYKFENVIMKLEVMKE